MVITEEKLRNFLMEEMTKSEITSLIATKIDNKLDSRDFKKKVKEMAADVVNEIFKILYQRNGFWKSASISG